MGIYEFKDDDAFAFARFVGIETKQKGHNLHFIKCPYCQSTKDKGTFAIDLTTGKFTCLRSSCGVRGNMITLAKDFNFSLGGDAEEYYTPKKRYKALKTPVEPIKPKKGAIDYLESRGVSKAIIERYEITTRNDNDKVLVFPFYDESGKLQFVKYRKTDFDKSKDKNKEWCEANTKPILFGMKQCNPSNDTLVITEGQIDSLSVATAGVENAVSVPTGAKGFTWLPYCWDWLSKFRKIVIFGDYERGTISLLDELKKRLKMEIRHVREEDYKDCKDANEILQKYGADYLRKIVENAVEVPVERVVNLSAVKNVDIFKIEKLRTGLNALDTLLYGGLPFGFVHIIAGKRGDGKSTLASQIVAQSIEQGFKTFVYSGELTNGNFKAWIDFQIAGKRNIVENAGKFGTPYYFITNTNQDKINAWYDERCFLYDNSIVESEEKEDLLKTLETAICRYGIRVVLIDNLMTALDIDADEHSDKYERQSVFVKKLARIAMKYDCLVLLVAHRRKNNYTTDANDEISGSADITNLAGVVVSYDRCADYENQFDRKLIVGKNRLFGRLNTEGYQLHFEEKSKRIYGNGDNVDVSFSWESSDGFAQTEISPFD